MQCLLVELNKGGFMRFFKRFILSLISLLFLLSLNSVVFADPEGGGDPVPPVPILPGEG